ncbi:MAG: histidine kinase N-terminal 7TM domain-containing protein [Methanoregula sp.]
MTLFSITPLAVAGLSATVFLIIIGYFTWQFRSGIIGRVAELILAVAAIYSFFFTLSLATTDPGMGLILVILQLPPRLFLPVLSFLFILLYIGEIERITPRMLLLTCLVPAIVLVVALTQPLHNLFVTDMSSSIADGRIIYSFVPGPFFWLSHLYSSILIIAGVSLAGSRFFRSPPLYRIQIMAILLAFVVPFFMHIGLIFIPDSWFSVLVAIGGFGLTGVAIYIATSRYRFLTLAPVAIPVLFDQMTDGVIIVNIQNLVVDANPAAARILGKDRYVLIGKPADSLIPAIIPPESLSTNAPESPLTITFPVHGKPHYYDLHYIPLPGHDQVPGGKILMLHDSHVRHSVELGLLKSNEKLQLLTSITRHDILNTLTALMGSLQLARAGPLEQKTDKLLERAEDHADLLRSQIEFTRDYQTLGLTSAQWQNVKEAIGLHLPRQPLPEIVIDPRLGGVDVFADPMFGQVFYNLIDNSIRHGERLSRIRIGGDVFGEGFLIWYEDDGGGIPVPDKERIFNKGYGKNTGLGLFLTREILALTGIQIRETGKPGKCVRFEMRVPHEGYRLT